ncbi:DNA primase large subunit [Bacillus phage vB_BanS_Sophrita]|uniref:DNA primase large subunit n=1 Tax=Bacillus phage vB_BanS_Sophrita TaxID=2894790 RepID=A0AAE8YTW9_9CAUD|nr:DNA primase large subunit [Bacillus phage vB_BanS_Sophrita]UGO50690.1 DNA primase large subunit [Bacillus phage vB_BanS_Sophrita]
MVNTSITEFIETHNLPEDSRVLFQTFGDCHSFYITHLGRNKNVSDDLLDYREEKIKKSNVSFDMFRKMCYTYGIRHAFEKTFLQAFDTEQIVLIGCKLHNQDVELETIYNGFQKNPNKNILRYVL